MPIVSAPFAPQAYSPTAQSEQELAYELLSDKSWNEAAYLAFSEAFNRPMELSDGRLVILPMPSLTHQRVLRQFVLQAQNWATQGNRGEVIFAPHPIRLWPGKYREPDAMVWLSAHKDRVGERESGPPDLASEIVSPGNEPHDLETKFKEYAEAAIPEYWIIQSATRRVSVYSLDGRAYRLVSHLTSGDKARSIILPGFEVAVSDLFVES